MRIAFWHATVSMRRTTHSGAQCRAMDVAGIMSEAAAGLETAALQNPRGAGGVS
jgi:hypothetical protein